MAIYVYSFSSATKDFKRPKTNRRLLFIAVSSGVLLTLTFIMLLCNACVISHANGRIASRGQYESLPQCDAGLVLGCAERLSDGRVNLFFRHRMQAAAELIKNGKVKFLIVSGDNHRHGYDEPGDMKRSLIDLGVPEERIICDYAGFRTLDSVIRSQTVFGRTNLIVISQPFHIQRAIYLAHGHGIDAYGYAADDVRAAYSFKTRLREYPARVKACLDICLKTRPKFDGPPIHLNFN